MAVTKFTKDMMSMLPEWMKMARDENSVGAQFLDTFGVEFQDIENMLSDFQNNFFIGTANVDMIDIVFKFPVANENIFNIDGLTHVTISKNGEMKTVLDAVNLRRFYDRYSEPMFIADIEEGYVYIRYDLDDLENMENAFDYIEINGEKHFDYMIHHIWNPFDEFAYLLGIERLYKERNATLKERILDVFRNPANSTRQGIINGMARELGLAKESIIVNDFQDYAFRKTLFDVSGRPSSLLVSYANKINMEMAFTWDAMTYGEAKWKRLENGNLGLKFLPHLWDADTSMFLKEEFVSGVGDKDDLKVYKPEVQSSTRNFKAYVGLKGFIESTENIYPELEFKYMIYAEGKIANEKYPLETYKYTIKASEIVAPKYRIEGTQRYRYITDLNFAQTSRYEYNRIPQGIDSNTVLHTPTNKQLQVTGYMRTNDGKVTPQINQFKVIWKDSTDAIQEYVFDTLEDFTQNNTMVTTELVDTFVTNDGTVELGFGEFYSMTDSKGAWEEAYTDGEVYDAIEILDEGSITLRLPKA